MSGPTPAGHLAPPAARRIPLLRLGPEERRTAFLRDRTGMTTLLAGPHRAWKHASGWHAHVFVGMGVGLVMSDPAASTVDAHEDVGIPPRSSSWNSLHSIL